MIIWLDLLNKFEIFLSLQNHNPVILIPASLILLGHKGNTFLEAGFIYAPYIPLQLTQTIYDPNDFTPRKGIMTRYAKKMVNNRFYGVIRIDNINTYANVYSVA